MQLYRITVKPVMSFSSQLQSDTFFGAFCWNYRYYCGETELEYMLKGMREGHPSVIFSNAFPKDTLPLPLGIRDTSMNFEDIEKKEERKRAFQNHKKLKGARFVRREWFEKIMEGDYNGFTAGLAEDGYQEQTVMHNMVSRQAGTVMKLGESGNLYDESEVFTDAEQEYDIYLLSSLDSPILKEVIERMFLLGIGRNKSVGKGAFEVKAWLEEPPFTPANNTNGYMALSNFVPARHDPTDGWYKTLVKYGKLDREYAASEIPFKKPVLFLQAGAVFYDDEVKEYYGKCLEGVSIRKEIVTSGYTIAMPMHLKI